MEKLIQMCDALIKQEKSGENENNEILKAREQVAEYVGNNKDRLLQLKAQAGRHLNYENETINHMSMLIAAISLIVVIFDVVCGDHMTGKGYAIVLLFIFLAIEIVFWGDLKRAGKRGKWKWYINIVIEEMEKEWSKDHPVEKCNNKKVKRRKRKKKNIANMVCNKS